MKILFGFVQTEKGNVRRGKALDLMLENSGNYDLEILRKVDKILDEIHRTILRYKEKNNKKTKTQPNFQ